MGNFFAELKRRHMYRVAAAYAVVAWVLLQIVNNVAPGLNLPNWAVTLVIVLLAVGFPIVLVFAWILELRSPTSDGAAAPKKVTRLDFALVGALALVIALVSYQQLAPSSGTTTRDAGTTAAAPAGISIAVLPFANMSGDAAQEFFSDGMTEEINAALTKVPDLRVVARTSAFAFKGQNGNALAVGQALGASHLIEGSVRKAGNRVRITAQLVQADNGLNLWSENYDRELTDIFAIQEEIAQAVAGALRVPLGLTQGDALVRSRTKNEASYEDYLRARALVRARGLKQLTEAAALLEQVVARDPGYAPAWALMALAYVATPNFHPAYFSGSAAETRRIVDASLPRAEAAAQRAIQLDSKNADGYVSLGYVQAMRAKLLQAEELYVKALELDANHPDALHLYSLSLAEVGRLKEAVAMRQRLQTLEPFVPNFRFNTAFILFMNGRTDDALALLKDVSAEFAFRPWLLAWIGASLGRYDEASETLLQFRPGTFLPGTAEDAARLLRTAPSPAATAQALPLLGTLHFVYLHIGAQSRVLEIYENNVDVGYSVPAQVADLWHPSYAPVRKTERFKAFARNIGLVEYWRAKGWPEFCHPTTGDDFACE